MIAGILAVLAVLAVLGTAFAIEATDKGSRLWQKRWCKRHGLPMRRATFAPDAEAETTSCGAPQQMELFAS